LNSFRVLILTVKAIQEIFLLTVSYPDHLQADKYQEGTCVYIVTPTNGTLGINFIAEYWEYSGDREVIGMPG
jgi:hypothetical protein